MVNEVEIGDKVKINKSYGGGKGKVTNKIGSFVVVNNKSYHETDVKVIAEKFTERGVPFPITEPPKEAYSEFKKWASKNEKSIKKDLIKYTGDASKLFKRMQYWWEKWSNSDAKKEWSNIKGIKFGRSLMVMMKKDNIIISKSGNKLTNLKEANVSWTTLHRDNAKNNLLRQTKLSSKEYQKAKKLKGFNKGNYKWNGDLYVKTIKESSKRDPESIKKEYKDLKKQSISFLRKEWSRSNKVGNPKSLDKEGLLSDILRDRHGGKYVDKAFEGKLTEANKGKVHKAAKKGSYPAVIVVVQDGKVIHQEPVSTPEVAPATFNVMQKKYPKALLHLEDKTGKRLFSELVVTEAAYANATRNELAQYIINLSNELKYAKANKDKKEIKYLEKDIALVKAALKKIKNESVNGGKLTEEFKKGTKIAIKSPKGRSHNVDMYIVKYTGDGYFYTDAGERSSKWIDEEDLMKLLKTKKAVVEGKLTEIKKGDYIDDFGDIGLVNKVKGQTAYVKFNLMNHFQPVPVSDLKKKGTHKGKDLYVLFEGKLTEALKKGDKLKSTETGEIIFILEPKGDGYDYNSARNPRQIGHARKEWFDMMIKRGKLVKESVNEAKFAGWIAGYNGKQVEIKKGEAKDLYNAKLLAIKKLKVPKSKVGLMFIKPAVDEGKLKESTAAWEKSLKDMARSKQLSMLSKGEKSKLLKIAQMLKTANEAKLEKEKFTEPEQMRESQTIKLSELKSFIENLWTNIRKKKARGEKPSEPGQKGYPNKQSWDSATNEMKIESINPLRHPKNKH